MTVVFDRLKALPGDPLGGLDRLDRLWSQWRSPLTPPPAIVHPSPTPLGNAHDADVIVAGGTLGILLATALQQRGWRVCVLERGQLQGRTQEWNISRQELQSLTRLGLLTEQEWEVAIASEYNPSRIQFLGGDPFWVRDVLNVGIDPAYLLACLKDKFLAAGGKLLEHTALEQVRIDGAGVTVRLTGGAALRSRLLVDAMGHFSPIARQARGTTPPRGVCLVVGTCAQGFNRNDTGDLLYSFTPIQNHCQYFWEAFPARDGRTTYLFTYVDPHPDRFSLRFFLEEYLRLLPEYQGCDLAQLTWRRLLFGFFPAHHPSPLQLPWDRLIAVGDSSGQQSPVSFGGFGAMLRHLERLTVGLDGALKGDFLDRSALAALQPYQPGLSTTWLFQKTMGVPYGWRGDPLAINRLLHGVFQVMDRLGPAVMQPFLQDVVQFGGLLQTLTRVDPRLVLPLLPQVGVQGLGEWLRHFLALGMYSGLDQIAPPLPFSGDRGRYLEQCRREAWRYGSGRDGLSPQATPQEVKP